MSNGLGAGFGGLMLLAVLVVLALVLAVAGGVALALQQRTDRVPAVVQYLALALLVAVAAVAGFAVLALYDEAATLAWLFAALVVVPLVIAGGYLRRTTSLPWREVAATAAYAWSVPFVGGAATTLGAIPLVSDVLGLAPAEARSMGLAWVAAGAGGLLVTVATVVVVDQLAERLQPATPGDARPERGES